MQSDSCYISVNILWHPRLLRFANERTNCFISNACLCRGKCWRTWGHWTLIIIKIILWPHNYFFIADSIPAIDSFIATQDLCRYEHATTSVTALRKMKVFVNHVASFCCCRQVVIAEKIYARFLIHDSHVVCEVCLYSYHKSNVLRVVRAALMQSQSVVKCDWRWQS